MSKKVRKYHNQKTLSPVVLGKKLEKLSDELDLLKKSIEAVNHSYNLHMDYLSNFARHDMGNAIQNISATLKILEGKIEEDIIKSLQTSVNNLDSTLSNLGQLIPYSPAKTFKIYELIKAVEILVRESSLANKVKIIVQVDRNSKEEIAQPFQALLQLLHNLIINAQKALKETKTEKIIFIEANIVDDVCVIKIKDTGCGIPEENIEKIFKYGFSTTDGSGIGLFHAKYLCNEIGGEITVSQNEEKYSTIFTLMFPKNGSKKDTDN